MNPTSWISNHGRAYSSFIGKANRDWRTFARFRRAFIYTRILEQLKPKQGEEYLKLINNPVIRDICFQSEGADRIGFPRTALFEGKRLSPTTIRYAKIANDIASLFALESIESIVEIGIGYGGQARILCDYAAQMQYPLRSYTLIDLPEVLTLARTYMEHFTFTNSVSYRSRSELGNGERFDLVISNFAFSELEKSLQQEYLEKVLQKSRYGFLLMNSGKTDPATGEPLYPHAWKSQFSQAELMKILPNAAAHDEVPMTGAINYLLTFGGVDLRSPKRPLPRDPQRDFA